MPPPCHNFGLVYSRLIVWTDHLSWPAVYKIFATSNNANAATELSEANLQVFDNHVNGCYGTYKDMIKRVSYNEEMVCEKYQLPYCHDDLPYLDLISFKNPGSPAHVPQQPGHRDRLAPIWEWEEVRLSRRELRQRKPTASQHRYNQVARRWHPDPGQVWQTVSLSFVAGFDR